MVQNLEMSKGNTKKILSATTDAKASRADARVRTRDGSADEIKCYRCQQTRHTKGNCLVPQKRIHCSKCGSRDHNRNPSCKGKMDGKRSDRKKSPRRTLSQSPRLGEDSSVMVPEVEKNR